MPNNPFIDLADENRALTARVAELEAALRDLVALKAIKARIGKGVATAFERSVYEAHKDQVWSAVRAALLSDKEKS